MKILFYGNQGNISYRLARWLRMRKIETKLITPFTNHSRSLPEWENPLLINNYPNWIKRYRQKPWHNIFAPKILKQELNNYDILITTGRNIISALKLKIPIVFLPVGYEITMLPFNCDNVLKEILSYIYRKNIANINKLLTSQEDIIFAAKLLQCGNKIEYLNFPIDFDQINHSLDQQLLKNLTKKYSYYDKVFINLSRKNLDSSKIDYKGTEKFLYAFRNLIKKKYNIKVIFGMHGNDVGKCKEIIKKLKMQRYFDYVEHLPLPQLHAYLSLPNSIVFDQFGPVLTNLAGIARETLALGNILVCNVDFNSTVFKKTFNSKPPFFFAYEIDEIESQMSNILKMNNDKLSELRRMAKEWAYQNLHWENYIDHFIEILGNAIDEWQNSQV